MTYDELVTWAESIGRSEKALLDYQDWCNAKYCQDMTTKEIFESIQDGSLTPCTIEIMREYWNGLEHDDQAANMIYMLDHWQISHDYMPARCPTCGEPTMTIFDHVDECPTDRKE